MSRNNEKFLFNVTDLTKAFEKSPNTVRNAIKDNSIKPVRTHGNTKFYALADVAPFLVPTQSKVRGGIRTIDNTHITRAQELIQVYGGMKEYKEAMNGELAELKFKEADGKLIDADSVAFAISKTLGALQAYFKRLPNRIEEIRSDWTSSNSEQLDAELARSFDSIIEEIEGYAHECDDEFNHR